MTFLRRTLLSCLLLVLATGAGARQPAEYGRYAAAAFAGGGQLVNWNSPEGRLRLRRAGQSEDFWQLAHHYQPQANPLYCGIASSVMVLNALRVGRAEIPSQSANEARIPAAWGGGVVPYPLYSQAGFLDAATEPVKPRAVIEFRSAAADGKPDPGLTLQQLRGVLQAHGAQASAHHADLPEGEGVAAFRQVLRELLGERERFLIVNYDSRSLGQAGGGHISPLAAYDGDSDSVLLLDVSGHLNPWLWVPVRDLYMAMHTLDGERFRGYVIVSEGGR